ncbi:hypothetical protein TIFTF001_021630 [Ficus carica]|uniref:Uncharacterized protein n=1 Tax=Ficus carica TaxID=3494 RepID=A0AA88AD34_FICCA|nr:hypothetical protein TIFTF001_021630 [Ficus carica]
MAFGTPVWFELTIEPLHSKSNLVYCATNPRQTVLGSPWQPCPPAVWPPPTDYNFSPAAGNHPFRSPASRVAEEETEPLEAPPFWAATALMGTRLRSLEEEEEEIGGGGGHGDGVPDGDGGGGGDGRELGRL